jgi:tRNA-specific 2-thiouridylase
MKRIVVGMSGGVDSSLSAALLHEQGWEVIGVSLKLWPCGPADGDNPDDACCSPTEARSVCLQHGLRHYVVDMEEQFRRQVVDELIRGYAGGETPNPCIVCNETVKFGDLWHYARQLGAEAVATGHYARIASRDGRLCPRMGHDRNKDQSYFLFSLNQEQLAAVRFPLGEMTKDVVRVQAAERGFINAGKGDSQDLCFVGDEGVAGFLREQRPDLFVPGPVTLEDGTVLGEHQGLAAYTIGQRKGIGVAWTMPIYVVEVNIATNTLIMAPKERLFANKATIRDCRWHLFDTLPATGLRCMVRNRHRGRLVPATIVPDGVDAHGHPRATIHYENEVPLPSPGQAAVAYDLETGTYVLGGGWFERPSLEKTPAADGAALASD